MDTLTTLPPRRQAERTDAPFHLWDTDGEDWIRFYRNESGFLMRFPGLADYLLSKDGLSVTCRPVEGTSCATLDHLYQNQVKPMVLSLQGRRVYHGAAIEYDGGAIALLGPSGQGKSSLTASFAHAGQSFLNDDLLVLEPSGDRFQVLPSAPSLRLWRDARAELLGDSCHVAEPLCYTDKERVLASAQLPHCDRPLPLRAAIVLGEDVPDIAARPLSGADATAAWMANVFVLEVDRPVSVQAAFAATADIARAVPSIALDYPREYDALPKVRAAILSAVQAVSRKGAYT